MTILATLANLRARIDVASVMAARPIDHDALAIAMAADGAACRAALNRLGVADDDALYAAPLPVRSAVVDAIMDGMDPAEAARAGHVGRPR